MQPTSSLEEDGRSEIYRRNRTETAWKLVLKHTRAASLQHNNSLVRLHSMNLGVTAIVISEEQGLLKAMSSSCTELVPTL